MVPTDQASTSHNTVIGRAKSSFRFADGVSTCCHSNFSMRSSVKQNFNLRTRDLLKVIGSYTHRLILLLLGMLSLISSFASWQGLLTNSNSFRTSHVQWSHPRSVWVSLLVFRLLNVHIPEHEPGTPITNSGLSPFPALDYPQNEDSLLKLGDLGPDLIGKHPI